MDTKTTPCIRNCCLDKQDVCMGCFRTLEEILRWHELNEKDIQEALREAEKRRLERHRLYPDAKLTSK
ncbi:DUF1289 domain-containing protein [Marinomonas sp. 2405UD68-3]|uniref:DUF1289 domain-containing protein n=1 Tax=Marinomonas sp. 2405UD68-3 TaxID=3391835 RepID=UPI0039C911C2